MPSPPISIVGDFLWRAIAAQRDRRVVAGTDLWRVHLLRHRRFNRPWRHRIDANALLDQIFA